MAIFGHRISEAKVRDILDRLEKLERSLKALELEWEDAYDKLRHMMGRVAKRAEALERSEQQIEHGVALPPATGIAGLSPRAAQIQERIRQARQRRLNGGDEQ